MKIAMAHARIDDARAREQLLQSAEHLAEAIDQMRSLAAELTPPMLYQAGLMPTLAWLAQRLYADHGLEVTIDADEVAEALSDDFKAFVFQAVRELLLNVVKHAHTHRAAIVVQRSAPPGFLEVVVSDQGIGCDAAQILKHSGSGFGLMSIRERLRGLGGAFDLRRGDANGCRVMLSVPLVDPEGPRERANGHHTGG
jgi:signal transduction histidine kinase